MNDKMQPINTNYIFLPPPDSRVWSLKTLHIVMLLHKNIYKAV